MAITSSSAIAIAFAMAITSSSANAIAFAMAISSASDLHPASYNSSPALHAIVLALGAKP